MKKTLYALIAAVTITMTSLPARAGYWDAAVYLRDANTYGASAVYNANFHMLYSINYNYVDWGLGYNAWANAASARDQAWYAYLSAPVGSYAEYYAYYGYYLMGIAVDNLWAVYVYGGIYSSLEENAANYAYYAQVNLAQAALAAAGRY